MIAIGWRNLRQTPFRFALAVGSVAFAVVLITCLLGMLFGMTRNASILVDRCHADLLVSSPNNKTFDFASPISQRKMFQVASIPGVAHVEEYNAFMSVWKLSDGGNAAIQVVAVDIKGDLAPQPKMITGNFQSLHNQDAVIIDKSAQKVLGNVHVGDHVEIFGKRAQVAGICQDMQSFSTIPMVFTSLRRGGAFGRFSKNKQYAASKASIYFLVRLAGGADPALIRKQIEDRVRGVEVHTRESLSWRTRKFWMIETGIGLAFLFVGFLGLLIGGMVLSQTLFALTIERLSEFGVLKALGASMTELSRVVLEQGLLCGGGGLALGLLISFGIQALAHSAGTNVEIEWPLVTCVSTSVMAVCAGASLLSIQRLYRLEPAMVFRA